MRQDKGRDVKGEPSSTVRADRLMQDHRFAEAIASYEERLETAPGDLAALLKLGICHLFNRSEWEFLRIFRAGQEQMMATGEPSAEVRPLWERYQSLAGRVLAGALVVGGLAVGGCAVADAQAKEAAKPQPQVTAPGDLTPGPAGNGPQKPVFTGHRYSGGVYLPMEREKILIPSQDQAPKAKGDSAEKPVQPETGTPQP